MVHWVKRGGAEDVETMVGVTGYGLELIIEKVDGGWLATFANRHQKKIYGTSSVAKYEGLKFAEQILEVCLESVKRELSHWVADPPPPTR